MAQHDHDVVVSARTNFSGPSEELSKALHDLHKGEGGSTGTGAHRTTSGRAVVPKGLTPENYIAPTEKYILVEQPDKRFRLIGTAKESKVTLLHAMEDSVAGDNRVRVTNTTAWPNSVHGHCIITYPTRSNTSAAARW